MSTQILVVEDEAAIATLIRFTLEQAGYSVACVDSVAKAQAQMREALPDLLLLDWMLPVTSGVEFIRLLRQDLRSRELPIILLTARAAEEDKEQGLNRGADDYLTKPFSPRELIARINALLRRRAPQKTGACVEVEGLVYDPEGQALNYRGKALSVAPTEAKLLHFFMTHPGRTYSRGQLLDQVWGEHAYLEERTVDVHIRRLRLALAPAACEHWIETVRGLGYRFSPDAAAGEA